MALPQSTKTSGQAQGLTLDNIVELFQIDLSRYGLGKGYFANDVLENGDPIKWGGNTYLPLPVKAEGFGRTSEGTAPRPTLTLANIGGFGTALVSAGQDLVGCEVRRYVTFRPFLDDGEDPDPDSHFPPEIWRINRKTGQNKMTVTWELASVFDQEGVKLPKRQVIRDYCSFAYRYWDKTAGRFNYDAFDPCPYAGNKYFDVNGKAVNMAKDQCGKHLRDCELRFGKGATLPIHSFPGVGLVK